MTQEEPVKGDKSNENDENGFYCAKCYDMVNYFIEECHTISTKSIKLENLYTKSKKERSEYKSKLDTLQFDYDELKAIKEDLEEKFNCIEANPSDVTHVKKSTTINNVKNTAKIEIVYDNDSDQNDQLALVNQDTHKLSLDIDTFNKYFINNHIVLNRSYLELMFNYLAGLILNTNNNEHKSKIVYIKESNTKSITCDIDYNLSKEVPQIQLTTAQDESSLKRQNEELTNQLRIQEETNLKLVQELEVLNSNLCSNLSQREDLDTAKVELNWCLTQIDSLTSHIQELTENQDRIVKECDELNKSNTNLKSEIESSGTQINSLTQTTSVLNQQKDELENALNNLKHEFSQLNDSFNANLGLIEILKTENHSLNVKLAEMNCNNSESINLENQQKENIQVLKDKLEDYEAGFRRLDAEKNELNDQLVNKYSDLLAKHEQLENNELKLKQDLFSLNTEFEVRNNRIFELENELKHTSEQKDQLYEKLIKSESTNEIFNSQLNFLNQEIESLKTNNSKFEAEINALSATLKEKINENEAVYSQLDQEKCESLAKTSLIESLKITIEESKNQLESLSIKNVNLSKNLKDQTDLQEQIVKESEEFVKSISDRFSSEISILKSQITEFESQLNNCKIELEHQKVEYQNLMEMKDKSVKESDEFVKSINDQFSSEILILKSQIDESNQTNDHLIKEFEELNKNNNQLKLNIESSESQMSSLTETNSNLNQQNAEIEHILNNLKNEFSQLSNEFNSNLGLLESFKIENQSLSLKLAEMNHNHEQFVAETQSLINSSDSELKQNELKLLNEKEDLISQLSKTREDHSHLSAKIEKIQAENEIIKSTLSESNEKLKQNLDQLKTEFDSTEERLKNLISESNILSLSNSENLTLIENLKSQNDELNSKLNESSEQINQLNLTNIILVKDTTIQIEAVQLELNSKIALVESLTDKNQLMETKINDLITQKCIIEDQYNQALKDKFQDYETEIKRLDAEKNELNDQLVNKYNDILAKHESLENNKLKLKQDIYMLNTELEVRANRITDLEIELRQLNEQKCQLDEKLSKSESVYLDLGSQLDQKKCESLEMMKLIESLKITIEESKNQLESLSIENVNLSKNLKDQTDLQEQIVKESEEFVKSISDRFSSEISILKSQITEFESQLNNCKTELEHQKVENQNLMEMKEKSVKEADEFVKSINDQFSSEITILKSQIDESNQKFDQIMNQYDELNKINSQLKSEIENFGLQMSSLTETISNLNQKNSELEHILNNSNQKYDELLSESRTDLNKLSNELESQKVENKKLLEMQDQIVKESDDFVKSLNDQLKSEIECLSTKLNQSNEANSILVSKSNELNSNLEKTKLDLSLSLAQIDDLKASSQSSETNYKNLKLENEQLSSENSSLQIELTQLKDTLENLGNENHSQTTELNHTINDLIKDNSNLKESLKTLESEANRFIAERDAFIEKLKENVSSNEQKSNLIIDNLNKKLNDSENIKCLEFAELKKSYESTEFLNSQEIKDLRDKLDFYENKIKNSEANIKQLDEEKSELRSQLIEYEDEIECVKDKFKAQFESQLVDYQQKAIAYELKYNDLLKQNQIILQEFEASKKSNVENELKLNEEIFNLNSELEEFRFKCVNLDQLSSLMEEIKIKLSDKEKESKQLSQQNSALHDENSKLHTVLSSNEIKIKELSKERDSISKELSELQRKLCDSLMDKDNLVKSIADLGQQLSQMQSHLTSQKSLTTTQETVLSSSTTARVSSSQMSESFICKIDKHIDSNIQQKLDGLIEEKQKYLAEIQGLKADVSKLSRERRVYKEEHSQNKSLKSQVEKLTNEIKKLNDTIKEMEETNEFLNTQVSNLNNHIYELSNKENDAEVDAANTSQRKSLNASVSRKQLGNKRLMEVQNECVAASPVSSGKQLANVDMNESLGNNQNENGNGDHEGISGQNPPMTPSSARKLNQCAQQ